MSRDEERRRRVAAGRAGRRRAPDRSCSPTASREATAVTAMNVAIRRTSPRSISDRRSLVNSREPVSEPRNVTGPVQLPPEAQLSVSAPHRVSMPLVGREPSSRSSMPSSRAPSSIRRRSWSPSSARRAPGKTRLVAEWLARLLSRQAAGTAGRPRVYRGAPSTWPAPAATRSSRASCAIASASTRATTRPTRHEKVRTQLIGVLRRSAHGRGRRTSSGATSICAIRMPATTPSSARSRCRRNRATRDRIARTVLRRFLELDAERTPLVLAFDDLHLADDDSLTLLAELAEGLGGSPVLLVAAARPELFVRRPGWGSGSADHSRLDLPPLTRDESEKLLARPPGQGRAAAARSRRGRVRADARQSLLHRGAGPRVSRQRHRAPRRRRRANGASIRQRALEATLPMSVEEAIQARIASLSPSSAACSRRRRRSARLLAGRARGPAAGSKSEDGAQRSLRRRGAGAHRGGARGAGRARLSPADAGLDGAGRGRVHLQAQPRARPGAQAGAARARAPLLPRRRRVARQRACRRRAEQTGEQLELPGDALRQGRQPRTRRRRATSPPPTRRARATPTTPPSSLYARGLALLDDEDTLGAHRSAAQLRRRPAARRQAPKRRWPRSTRCSRARGGSTHTPRPARRTAASRACIARSANTTMAEEHLR